jgi:hypothetical protein
MRPRLGHGAALLQTLRRRAIQDRRVQLLSMRGEDKSSKHAPFVL